MAFVHAIVFVVAYMVLQYLAGYGGYGYMVYDDDEEGFQTLKKQPAKRILTPEELLKLDYNSATSKCSYYSNLKDKEYDKGRTDTKRFRQIESLQRDFCDKANNLRNKLRDLGFTE